MNLIPGRNYTVAAGRQIFNACTHPHSKIFFAIFSDVFISFRTGYSFFVGWFVFLACVCVHLTQWLYYFHSLLLMGKYAMMKFPSQIKFVVSLFSASFWFLRALAVISFLFL